MPRPLTIVWFKRDVRIVDHRPLAGATAAGNVLPLYIAEPGLWAQPDASARQWEFVAESLCGLQHELAALGQPLCVMVGEALPILQRLHRDHGIAALWSHQETGNDWTYARDRAVLAWTAEAGIPWNEPAPFGVARRLKSRTGWAAAWERTMAEAVTPPPRALRPLAGDWPTRIPTAADLGLAPDPCPCRQPGGREAGLSVLASFLATRGRDYRFRMSSPVTAFDASSRLSSHLAWGTLSLREVAQATKARLQAVGAATGPDARRWRDSLTSFDARLHWHCHFMQKLEDEPRIEFKNLHPAYDGLRPEHADAVRLSAWSEGRTGFPFIDACMRALDRHGWLNFRMRAMLMSFASYHLWLPWRDSGLHLARAFVDYEPGIHWPQVQMQSGTTGINAMRVYNPVKQSVDQDPEGRFIRAFVPELSPMPDAYLHEPWLWPGASGLSYPPPIVNHVTAAQAARNAVHAVRQGAAHKQAARDIVAKHGSRTAGLPNSERRRSATTSTRHADRQLSLDL